MTFYAPLSGARDVCMPLVGGYMVKQQDDRKRIKKRIWKFLAEVVLGIAASLYILKFVVGGLLTGELPVSRLIPYFLFIAIGVLVNTNIHELGHLFFGNITGIG